MPVSFSLEGNIAAGKSTFLDVLTSVDAVKDSIAVFHEPVEIWQNINGSGENMLDAFYQDQKRFAYCFQSFVFITRFLQHHGAALEKQDKPLHFLERSVFSDRFAFAQTAISDGTILPVEAQAYFMWFESVIHVLPNLVPDVFVYLRASPETCHARVSLRARTEESPVSLDYLQKLHACHEDWFMKGSDEYRDGNLVEVRVLRGERTHPLLDGKYVIVVNCDDNACTENRRESIEKLALFFSEFKAVDCE